MILIRGWKWKYSKCKKTLTNIKQTPPTQQSKQSLITLGFSYSKILGHNILVVLCQMCLWVWYFFHGHYGASEMRLQRCEGQSAKSHICLQQNRCVCSRGRQESRVPVCWWIAGNRQMTADGKNNAKSWNAVGDRLLWISTESVPWWKDS